jgi:deoxyribose-phosphate aldolase
LCGLPRRVVLIELAGRLEHVLLRPGITSGEIDDACAAAVEAGLAAVTVWPSAAPRAVAASGGSRVEVVAAIGQPHGGDLDQVRRAIGAGAGHLAVVVDAAPGRELADVCRLAHAAGVHVRAVLRAHLLDHGELAAAARLAIAAGADLLQTGFGIEAPATADQVLALRSVLAPRHAAVGVIAGGAAGTDAVRELLQRGGALRVAVPDPAGVLPGVVV